jgi:toxin ParE1/3/4
MKTKRSLKIRAKAKNDLSDIWIYTNKNWSQKQADEYLRNILFEAEKLCNNPESGKNINLVKKNYWSKRVVSHIIIYKFDINNLHVIRVLHKNMDMKSKLIIN